MHIVDISPRRDATDIKLPKFYQSVSGKALCVAMSPDGSWVYLGGQSGVWRSEDGGKTWTHLERPQPPQGGLVTGALPLNVYDLLVGPGDPNTVLATTGRDAARPARDGLYRSTDGGETWQQVHQFQGPSHQVHMAAAMAAAVDDPNLVYAAGGAVAISADAGQTWREVDPRTSGGDAWYVVVGRKTTDARHVYALGTHVWHSTDGGDTWSERSLPFEGRLDPPADGLGQCVRCVCIHPSDPEVIYVVRNLVNDKENMCEIWRGDFSTEAKSGSVKWLKLPAPPVGYPGTTASGTNFIVAHGVGNTIYFIVSDRRTVHISRGEPKKSGDWTRIDGDPLHGDPHGIALSADFNPALNGSAGGRIVIVNDGGAAASSDGAATWTLASGLLTLSLVNAAILPRLGKETGICIGMGDNDGFFSSDGGAKWVTQDYHEGDNDATFSDPRQPDRLIVFAPRASHREVWLYVAQAGEIANGAWGTSQRRRIPGPPPAPGEKKSAWNAWSKHVGRGYRPVVQTLANESPRPDGDFLVIIVDHTGTPTARLKRTTALSSVHHAQDWLSEARSEGAGSVVFEPTPPLPHQEVDVVQASGGHEHPVYFVSNPSSTKHLWKCPDGGNAWKDLVPFGAKGGPEECHAFFVDPYRPDLLYVLGKLHLWRSEDGGHAWKVDDDLERAVTDNGTYPLALRYDGHPGDSVLRDMAFDPVEPHYRFAAGTAGVFATVDGTTWQHLLLSSAAQMKPNGLVYDRVTYPCARMLYVSTGNRGILKLGPLAPDLGLLPGQVYSLNGRLTEVRIDDSPTVYGPPSDALRADVVARLDGHPDLILALQIEGAGTSPTAWGMFNSLRSAMLHQRRVAVDLVRTGYCADRVIRVAELSGTD